MSKPQGLLNETDLVSVCNLPDYTTRISCCNHTRWNVVCNDAATTDDSTFADSHACHYFYVTGNSCLITNGDSTADESTLDAFFRIKAMVGTIHSYVRTNQNVVANCNA